MLVSKQRAVQVGTICGTLTGCRFCNGFYALNPKTCLQDTKKEFIFIRSLNEIFCFSMTTYQILHNSPYYIIYIVSVHAFESLCWKAHSNYVWVDICSGRGQGNVHFVCLCKSSLLRKKKKEAQSTITEVPRTVSLTHRISRSMCAFNGSVTSLKWNAL